MNTNTDNIITISDKLFAKCMEYEPYPGGQNRFYDIEIKDNIIKWKEDYFKPPDDGGWNQEEICLFLFLDYCKEMILKSDDIEYINLIKNDKVNGEARESTLLLPSNKGAAPALGQKNVLKILQISEDFVSKDIKKEIKKKIKNKQ